MLYLRMFQNLNLTISPTAHTFAKVFVLLAFLAIGHDIYLWVTSDDFPFAFAALGWLTKHYIPEYHAAVVAFIGVDTFNLVLTPILKIPAVFLAGGLALAFMGIGFILQRLADAKLKSNRRYKKTH